jgi:cullin 1
MLGLDESDAQRQQLDVYREYFQEPFILATAAYYKAESAAFSSNNSVSDYMKRAETRLQEEVDRVNLYLHDTTTKEVSVLPNDLLRTWWLTSLSSRRLARRF